MYQWRYTVLRHRMYMGLCTPQAGATPLVIGARENVLTPCHRQATTVVNNNDNDATPAYTEELTVNIRQVKADLLGPLETLWQTLASQELRSSLPRKILQSPHNLHCIKPCSTTTVLAA
jgi:hypothetical protein